MRRARRSYSLAAAWMRQELTGIDVIDAYRHFMTAAETLGINSEARADVLTMVTKHPGAAFGDTLALACSGDTQP